MGTISDIEDAVDAVRAVFKVEPAGGYLHSFIDDCNVDSVPDADGILDLLKTGCQWTGSKVKRSTIKRYLACVEAMKKLSVDEREYALAVVHGNADAWMDEHLDITGEEWERRVCES